MPPEPNGSSDRAAAHLKAEVRARRQEGHLARNRFSLFAAHFSAEAPEACRWFGQEPNAEEGFNASRNSETQHKAGFRVERSASGVPQSSTLISI